MAKPTKESQLSEATKKRIDAHHVASAQRAVAAEVIALEKLGDPVKAATSELIQRVAVVPDAQKHSTAVSALTSTSKNLEQAYEQAAMTSLGHARRLAMMQVESEALEAQAILKQLTGADVHLGALAEIIMDAELDAAKAHAAAGSMASKWSNSQLQQIATSQLKGEAAGQVLRRIAAVNGGMQSTVDLHASTLAFGGYGQQHTKAWNEIAPAAKRPMALRRPVDPVPFPLPPTDEEGFGTGGETGLPYGWGEGMMQIWSAILDRKTCPICFELDGNMVPIGKPWPGVGEPQAHPRCRCIPVTMFVPEAMSNRLPGIQIDYAELKADIKDYMQASTIQLGLGARHAQDYIREALQTTSPQALTRRLVERRGYFPNKPKPKAPKGGPPPLAGKPGPKPSPATEAKLKQTQKELAQTLKTAQTKAAQAKATEQALRAEIERLKAQAIAAQKEGQEALKQAGAADKAQAMKAAQKAKAAPKGLSPQEKLEQAKAKAAAYKAEQAALAKKKLLDEVKEDIANIHDLPWADGPELAKNILLMGKKNNAWLGEMYEHVLGKPASIKFHSPSSVAAASKAITKKLKPELKWPLTKAQQAKLDLKEAKGMMAFWKKAEHSTGPKFAESMALYAKGEPQQFAFAWKEVMGDAPMPKSLQEAGEVLAKKHRPDLFAPAKPLAEQAAEAKDLPAFIQTLTTPKVEELMKAVPELSGSPELLANLLKNYEQEAGTIANSIKDWQEALEKAKGFKLEHEPVSGKVYVNVFSDGKKTAYFYKEGEHYVVKPPSSIHLPQQTFTDEVHAAAYASQVSKEIQLEKQAAKAYDTPAKAKPAHKPLAPGQMYWSDKYQQPERAAVPIGKLNKPTDHAKRGLKPNRDGHSTLMDKDWIENFEVSFAEEFVDGEHFVVTRFKVNEHRAAELQKNLRSEGASENGTYQYKGLKSLDADKLELSSERLGFTTRTPPGVRATQGKVGSSEVTMLRQSVVGPSELAATHNLVEVRTKVAAGTNVKSAITRAERAISKLGVDTQWPAEEALQAHKRSKILAYVDRQGGNEVTKLADRNPEAVAKIWDKAVKRNPLLAEIEADAVLKEVATGHTALYSERLAKHLKDAGITHLSHHSGGGEEVLEQMFIHKGGLLSSRERYQRGLIFRGMSTSTDFETGGADSVFLRLQTSRGSASGSGLNFDIAHEELGRMDAYFFNQDRYGRSGPGARSGRKTAMEMAELAQTRQLSGNNEIMLQRQVAPQSIRRVTTDSGTRSRILGKFKAAGIEEINGIPIEDFVVTP